MEKIYNLLNIISIILVSAIFIWGAFTLSNALNCGQKNKKPKECTK